MSTKTTNWPEPESGDWRRLSEAEWRQRLDDRRYRICREQGTERAFSGEYWDEHRPGVYRCAACGLELFDADAKYDSGSGWPSYWRAIDRARVEEKVDRGVFMVRTEAACARCGSHLGHVFDDGPEPTGERFCVNSASLVFEPRSAAEE